MLNKIISGCIFLLIGFLGNAQNSINGTILNQDHKPLPGSHIHIGSKAITADVNGKYELKNLSSSTYKVFISFVGYQSVDTLITISNQMKLDFILKPKLALLDEVIVKQNGRYLNHSVVEQKIKLETIERYSNQTLGDALKEVSGVSLLKTGATIVKPILNGLHSSRVPIINNNVRLEDQQWGAEHAPNFDINAAGKITVIKGASGLQFGGDAVGGIVIIEPVSIKKDTLYGKTLLNLASNGKGGSLSTSLHKGNFCDWSWNVLGTFKYLGDKSSPNYILSNTGNRELNFSGDIKFSRNTYDFTAFYSFFSAQLGILKASHIGNVTDLFQSIVNKEPYVIDDFTYSISNPKQQLQHHIAKLNFNWSPNESSYLSFQYAFQFNNRLEFDVRRSTNANKPALDLDLATHSFSSDYKYIINNCTFKSGFNGVYQNNFANPKTDIRPLIPSYLKVDAGLYGITEYHISNKLTIESGVRYDFSNVEATKYYLKSRWNERGYSPEFDSFIVKSEGNQWLTKPKFTFHNLSASLGLHQKYNDNWEWFLNTSLASRNPNPSEFFSDGLHHATGMIELGDLRLNKEQSFKLSTTLMYNSKEIDFSFNPFINKIENYMFLKPIGFETSIRGAFPVWEYQKTNARLLGLDAQARLSVLSNWQYSFLFSYVNGYDIKNKLHLIDMTPLRFTQKVQFNKPSWNGFLVSIESEFVNKQNQFPDYNFNTNILINNEFSSVLVDISTPPKAYHLLHFYAEVKIYSFKKTITKLAFSVQNIENTIYRDYLNRQRFFADEMGRNFQLQLKINY